MTVIICCDNPESGALISGQLSRLGIISAELFYSTSDFLTKIRRCPDSIMLIAQTGALSTETAIAAREHNPKGKLIWFSNLDFALLSFRLKATYFGLLPIEDEKLAQALSYCEVLSNA